MAGEDKKTRIVCECKELDEEGNVLRTFPMSSTSENLKRQRRGVSTWNEQLKVVAALMGEVLGEKKAPSGLQLKIASKLKREGKIQNATVEDVRRAMNEIEGRGEAPKAAAPNAPPKPKSVELEDDSDEEKETELVANNSKGESRMQRQGGGGCGCTGGAELMKGGAGCGMWPASGGKRKGRKTTRKAGRKSRKASRKSKKSRKTRRSSTTRRR